MTPLEHWQRQLEQTLGALGLETGYDAEAMRVKQAEWVKETCLIFGTTAATAYQVAGIFAGALDNETLRVRSNLQPASDEGSEGTRGNAKV